MYDNLDSAKPIVIVTGGASGIGYKISEHLVEVGYGVIAISRNASCQDINMENFQALDCDLSNFSDTEKTFQELSKKKIRIVSLINNAGLSKWRSVSSISESFLDEMFKNNIVTAISATKFAVENFWELQTIINISSLAGKRGTTNNSIYVATKFAIEGLTKSWCYEFGGKGIRVNSICPVLIQTPGLLAEIDKKYGPANNNGTAEFLENFSLNYSPLKRLPDALDVAKMVEFLISSKADAITGQSINVDCGVLPG